MLQMLQALFKDRRGVAAVEFAILAPAIAGIAATSFLLWDMIARQRDMDRALKVGAEYYMNGGVSDGAAVESATAAWNNRPENGKVEASRTCRCGEVVASCGDLCPTSTPAAVYVTLMATASKSDSVLFEATSSERVVRVR